MDCNEVSALVTGGASGLGAATASALAARGAYVTILDRDPDAGEQHAAALGNRGSFAQADVTDPSQVAKAVELAAHRAPFRIAVNCAGIGHGARTVGRDGTPASIDDFARVVTVNLVGSYTVAAYAAAAMTESPALEDDERGLIINTASIAAFDGQIGQTAYSASKGGIVGMTLPMARDLSSVGIRVNTIAPGIVDTPLLAGLNDEMREALARGVPFPKRLGTPDDYSNLVLAIVDNGYLNGETIRMDGALRMPPR